VAEALRLVAPLDNKLKKLDQVVETSPSIFTEYGSDKDTRHSYGNIYLDLLKGIANPRILEIGVGSINNYPYAGLPAGGALKAFRRIFKDATIVGVDIDPDSIEIIKAEGFPGFIVDQTSEESLIESKSVLEAFGPFDLIVDDGFHDPHANIRTLKKLFSLLSENGTYVVEDVHESLIDFWNSISIHLPGQIQILDMRELRPGVDDNILILITN
jgi:SAM-dependent methyltransferase